MYIFIYVCINQGQNKPAQVVFLLIKVYSDAKNKPILRWSSISDTCYYHREIIFLK